MNIFVLDTDPKLAAQAHCDRHVVKMILETAQILSTVWFKLTPVGARYGVPPEAYKPTHHSHPCVLWASMSETNYRWLWRLGSELCAEYAHRYGRRHKTADVLNALSDPPHSIREITDGRAVDGEPSAFVLCMPEEFSADYWPLADGRGFNFRDAAVGCYREYYLGAKAHLLTYTNREPPTWVPSAMATTRRTR